MKVKYRILESRYSDGSVRFFPQRGDWWHGWGFYGQNTWSSWSNRGNRVHIWFDTLEKAETFLKREVEWNKTHDPKKETVRDNLVYQVKEITHNYSEEKK